MARIKRGFVFASSVLSGIGVLFAVISLATEQWVYSDKAHLVNIVNGINKIKYGLFQGTLMTAVDYITVQITMTCLAKENVCAMLCAKNSDDRFQLLQNLYDNKENTTQNENECPKVATSYQSVRNGLGSTQNALRGDNKDRKFINFGVWLSTLIFLSNSILFGLFSAVLSLYNTVQNPVQRYFGIYGIFIYNGIALCSIIIAVTVWGVFFQISIFHNIAIFHTLSGVMDSDKASYLGYSYWLNLIPIVLYIASISVLAIRQYKISHDPTQKIVQREEVGDPVIYLF